MAQKFCKSCGAELIPGKDSCPACLIPLPAASGEASKKQHSHDTPETSTRKIKEYKVIKLEEKWIIGSGGKINIKKLEETLNSYGLDGWNLKETTTRQNPGVASFSYEILIIFERDRTLKSSSQ
jgi:hypothetical protein